MSKLFKVHRRFLFTIKNLNLRYQLILSYIPIFIISLLVINLVSYYLMANTLKKNSREFVNETVKIISRDITKSLNQYGEISASIAFDENLSSLLSGEINDYNYFIRSNKVKQKLYYFTQNSLDIKSIFIYPLNRSAVIRSNSNIIYNDMNYNDNELFKSLVSNAETKVWSTSSVAGSDPEGGNYLYFLRAIPNFGTSNGLIQMQIREKSIFDIYKDSSFGKNSTIFIIDENGCIVSHPNKEKISTKIQPSIIENIKQNIGSFTTEIDGKNYMTVYSTIESSKWTLIATIPMDYIQSNNKWLLNTNLIIIMISFIFIILISVWVSSKIASPLERVGKAMKQLEKGDFEVRLDYDSNNEMGKIYKRYNAMAGEIKNLMEVIRKEEKKKKEAYIKVLQAQIKPHFLYNTLFTIKCLASIKKQPQIEELLDSLIRLLMASISKGGEFVSVYEEIEYIKNFALIQKYRFDDKFKVIFNISSEIQNYIVPKLIIQPIVENAIVHGMDAEINFIEIKIEGSVEGADIVFRIRDNGKGIDADKINMMLQASENKNKNGFNGMGIKNVNERIKLYFGEQYGLHYLSNIENGTEVIMRLPVIIDERGIQKYV
ncbi:hypothetical protein LF65_04381 [Clostridium beijerinckii]|uniref:HAMP domain-containing protein n=1 Tax=Clostridium beijerinckii TaxID=1520 RepID=A0A0B5QIY9_CLOBE|nr:histidine kinase [Clostridium beijerinckii]AJH00921.1 hypothetical protein LF65_04381 [Clostridium beijerinckii]